MKTFLDQTCCFYHVQSSFTMAFFAMGMASGNWQYLICHALDGRIDDQHVGLVNFILMMTASLSHFWRLINEEEEFDYRVLSFK
ncbi:CLUMA_CG010780, isoform A [Clunio marinus]|uniref:CLUMA_CG010780, isoform A n=1 Tax=Clunio marinus TaxID=568069 RepID=A0A1J1IEG2_9DIPT|nr:CLUMA_CG010780, isoform A [Clunio marinus]